MIAAADLDALARERLADAEALLAAGRYDGAAYLGGYVVELALKRRICETLGWEGFPSTRAEFQDYASFRTHKLVVLLRLSGGEAFVEANLLAEWSTVAHWTPESRYDSTSGATPAIVRAFVEAARLILNRL